MPKKPISKPKPVRAIKKVVAKKPARAGKPAVKKVVLKRSVSKEPAAPVAAPIVVLPAAKPFRTTPYIERPPYLKSMVAMILVAILASGALYTASEIARLVLDQQ